jgi:DNA (cytosine-5)-methyltransferase 1
VDLFAGAGGFSLGMQEACRRLGFESSVVFAMDNDEDAARVFGENFPKTEVLTESVEGIFDGKLGKPSGRGEKRLARNVGRIDILIGGPPCQGHSDLNNRTRRKDPRNVLYTRMVRAAEVLRPRAVLIENVPAVVHDVDGIVGLAVAHLREAGFDVASRIFGMEALGVPQSRKRHVLLAVAEGALDPTEILRSVVSLCSIQHIRTVRWALEDLLTVEGVTPFDEPSGMSRVNSERITWLFENDAFDLPNELRPTCHQSEHSYRSMYGRLRWDRPAQTITTGYGSIGQGRYVHPERRRALTPHEAARLQTFPDFFSFLGISSRTSWANMIGNAVPPLMGVALGERLVAALRAEEARDQKLLL